MTKTMQLLIALTAQSDFVLQSSTAETGPRPPPAVYLTSLSPSATVDSVTHPSIPLPVQSNLSALSVVEGIEEQETDIMADVGRHVDSGSAV